MKKLVYFILTLLAVEARATVLTVNNNANGGTPYTTIDEAIEDASSGDTIYIQGSPTAYTSFTLTDKKIVFIGPGFAPDKELPQLATVLGGWVRNTGAPGSSDGTEFNGLIISAVLAFSDSFIGSEAVNNIVIRRCKFTSVITIATNNQRGATNYLIESNYFSGSSIEGSAASSYSSFIIKNNVFRGSYNGRVFGNFQKTAGMLIDHNLFYSANSGALRVFDGGCNFLTITNNIFYRANAASGAQSINFSTFNNNITFNADNNTPWDSDNNVNSGGNIANQNPQLTDDAIVSASTDNPLADLSIAAGPANNAASDGKDIGLLFDSTGSLNWANARGSRLPFIYSFNIINPTIGPGTDLNIEVTAKKQN